MKEKNYNADDDGNNISNNNNNKSYENIIAKLNLKFEMLSLSLLASSAKSNIQWKHLHLLQTLHACT